MWIEPLDNGKYRYAERYKDPYTEKSKKISVVLDSNTRQTQNKAVRLLNQMIDERLSVKNYDYLTFGKLVDEWKESHSKTVKARTMRVYKNPIKKIQDFIKEDVLVKNIDVKILQSFVDSLKGKYADNTVNLTLQPLNLILEYAIRMEYIDNNPFDKVVRPKRKKASKKALEEKYMESSKFKDIITEMRTYSASSHVSNFAEVIYLTGMRPGELLALRWVDIDFDAKKIRIQHTLDYSVNGHANAVLSSAKTDGSERTIDAPDRVIDIMIEELNYQKLEGLESDFVFISRNGNHLSINTVNRRIKKASEKLYGFTVTSHTFRHAHVTLLAEMGIPLKAIMDRVGHSDVNTTIKIYTHTTEKMGRELLQKLNNLDKL
ncbi:tyrosine-type recombinase/integrase [Streptococcus canis]|uniref:tyrosine-type recombinase/integrase n=1 Tax=Streptococcus canis TaxID=1329 RepID=UPI0012F46455|nr:site-specific integrase [Streptococcus canis]GFE45949.1 prophage ps2 probable integrase [Streptococcus canis]